MRNGKPNEIQNIWGHDSPVFDTLPEDIKQLPIWNAISTHAIVHDFLGDLSSNEDTQVWSELCHSALKRLELAKAHRDAKQGKADQEPEILHVLVALNTHLISFTAYVSRPFSCSCARTVDSLTCQVLSNSVYGNIRKLVRSHINRESQLTSFLARILNTFIEHFDDLVHQATKSFSHLDLI